MTEQEAIERIAKAIALEMGTLPSGYVPSIDDPHRNGFGRGLLANAAQQSEARKVMGVDPEACPQWKHELAETRDYLRKHGHL